jgi:hypothetical protein
LKSAKIEKIISVFLRKNPINVDYFQNPAGFKLMIFLQPCMPPKKGVCFRGKGSFFTVMGEKEPKNATFT